MTITTMEPELHALKTRLKATWMDGNYDYFSRYMASSATELLDRVGVTPGAHWLDVACGSGQLALAAAARGATVTGVDIASNLVEAARGRALSAGITARFDDGDAEDLPYADASFDVVATLFGAMFAPRPERVAAELVRVCRPGGRIVMANWTPEGFIGSMFKTFARFLMAPNMPAPAMWGREEVVAERLVTGVSSLSLTRTIYTFDYPFGPADVVEFFRENYGPTTRAFQSLGAAQQMALRTELVALWSAHNRAAGSGRTIVDAEYLEVIATRA